MCWVLCRTVSSSGVHRHKSLDLDRIVSGGSTSNKGTFLFERWTMIGSIVSRRTDYQRLLASLRAGVDQNE